MQQEGKEANKENDKLRVVFMKLKILRRKNRTLHCRNPSSIDLTSLFDNCDTAITSLVNEEIKRKMEWLCSQFQLENAGQLC